jgi:hypothetical protein
MLATSVGGRYGQRVDLGSVAAQFDIGIENAVEARGVLGDGRRGTLDAAHERDEVAAREEDAGGTGRKSHFAGRCNPLKIRALELTEEAEQVAAGRSFVVAFIDIDGKQCTISLGRSPDGQSGGRLAREVDLLDAVRPPPGQLAA